MPPRTMQEVGTSPRSWYDTLPPITKTFATVAVLLTIMAYLGWIDPRTLVMLWPPVFKNFEVWRPITSCFFVGMPSMGMAFQIIWLLQYGVQLETGEYSADPASYIFMLAFGSIVLQAMDAFLPFVGLYFYGPSLIYMVLYVWARFHPDLELRIMGLVPIMSFYLPFAMIILDVLFKRSPVPGVCGVVVGHLWWFLTDLYPRTGGRELLATPQWLKRWCAARGIGPPPPPIAGQPAGFAAFRGQGQRLGAQ